jgi:sugar (pentulose or hexulose) kinase
VEAGLIELQTGGPAREIAKAVGLDEVSIPSPITSLNPAGSLRSDVAEALGLDSDTPVFNAGPDTQAGLYGMGVTAPGSTGIVAGWSCAVQRVTEFPVLDPERGLWTGRHVEPGRWILEANLGIMGGAYLWLCGLISPGPDPGEAITRLNRDVMDAPTGGSGLTVHLGPASTNMSSAGLRAGGLVFPVPLALHAPASGEIARAALEGFGFAIKSGIEQIDNLSGTPSTSLALGGGMTRSSAFAKLLASILGREIELGSVDATLSGAAMLAARALDGDAGPGKPVMTRISPDQALATDYEHLYEEWLQRAMALGEMPV